MEIAEPTRIVRPRFDAEASQAEVLQREARSRRAGDACRDPRRPGEDAERHEVRRVTPSMRVY